MARAARQSSSVPAILQVGSGRWGTNHLRTLLKLQAEGICRLVGVQDVDPERRKAIAEGFGVRTFADYSGLEEADAVDIVVPTYQHLEVAKAAAKAGKHFMVEKPVTQGLAEAKELLALCAKSDKVAMVGHIFRYNPAADYVRRLIADRELGRIRFMRGRFLGFRYQEHDAGILATTTIHFIYLSNFLHGKPPKAVRAKAEHLFGTKLDDYVSVHLDYGDSFTTLESDYFTPGKWRTFDVIGTQGAVYADLLRQDVEVHRKWHVLDKGRYESYDGGAIRPTIEFKEPLELELRHFIDCVRTGAKPLTSIQDGADVLKIIEAAYESSRSDKTIPL